jgi:hypothetical protein
MCVPKSGVPPREAPLEARIRPASHRSRRPGAVRTRPSTASSGTEASTHFLPIEDGTRTRAHHLLVVVHVDHLGVVARILHQIRSERQRHDGGAPCETLRSPSWRQLGRPAASPSSPTRSRNAEQRHDQSNHADSGGRTPDATAQVRTGADT